MVDSVRLVQIRACFELEDQAPELRSTVLPALFATYSSGQRDDFPLPPSFQALVRTNTLHLTRLFHYWNSGVTLRHLRAAAKEAPLRKYSVLRPQTQITAIFFGHDLHGPQRFRRTKALLGVQSG